MPLGKLTKAQIAKGYECLEEIEAVLRKEKKGNLNDLSSKFYTLIPHDFKRMRPPPINDLNMLQAKYDMLAVSVSSTFEIFISSSCFIDLFV